MSADTPPLLCPFELGQRYHSSTCDRMCQRTEGHVGLVHRCACGITVSRVGSSCLHSRTVKAMIGKTMVTQCAACELRTDVFPGDPQDGPLDGWDELYSSGEVPPETSNPGTAPTVDPQTERRERLWQAVKYVRFAIPPEVSDDAVVSLPVAHVRALLEEAHDQRRDMGTVDGYLKAAAQLDAATPRPLGEYL